MSLPVTDTRAQLNPWSRVAAVGLLAALAACHANPAPEPVAAPASIRPLVVEQVPQFAPTVVRFSPDSAAKLSAAGRAAVSAEVNPAFKLTLWAPEGLISDPVGLGFDDLGRAYVTRTARTNRDEIDIRAHPDWMVPSIGFKDVEDKRAFYQRILAPENSAKNMWLKDWNGDGVRDWHDLTVHTEKLYRVEDTNGDGIADFSQLILDDFKDLVTDVAHGVMAYKNDVYLTISPDMWRLRDTNGDGVIDTKEAITHGSGVHIGFGGHGHSGPLVGPDGRIYWKQGDLGVNITTRDGRHLDNPNSGVIIRANPDGTEAELFATGLRNPQEFAFDEFGNIISPDNDGDHPGELERLLYIVDGMDSGWRINWQFGKYIDPDNNTYKPWMAESMFKPRFPAQPAWFTPPLANWHAGPAGFAYNPGTALDESWNGYFFNAVFTGAPARASLQAFSLKPAGAGFKLVDDKMVTTGLLTTGAKFGPDGALYTEDWIEGWDPKERGRIWKIDVAGTANTQLRAETKALIAASFKDRSNADVAALLRHADMRVRTKAQFELVDRGATSELVASARQTDHQMARIHGMWGVGQMSRKDARQIAPVADMLTDGDPEIRAQAAKLLGDIRYGPASSALLPMLRDPSPRVRFFAAEALGRIRETAAIQPIIVMLRANNDDDVYLRHAGVTALARIGSAEPLVALAADSSRAVRVAAVVALRRMRNPGVARFLADRDEYVVAEAARAINDDGGINGANADLAALLGGRSTNEPLVRREINANLLLGTAPAALRLATYAGGTGGTDDLRAEAISALSVWPKPSRLDRVDGTDRGIVERDSAAARAALASITQQVFASGSSSMQVALAQALGKLRIRDAAPTLLEKARSAQAAEVRGASLRALIVMGDSRAADAVRTALEDKDPTVRTVALASIASLNLPDSTTAELLSTVISKGSIAEQQSALTSLAQLRGTTGREALTRLVDQLVEGKVAPEIQLEVAEAARASTNAPLIAKLDALEKTRAVGKPVAAYADALRGGDARRGQRIVNTSPSAECTRCHSFGAAGGVVGPKLIGVASRLEREQLLEALVDPSARIAPGFGPVFVTLKNGKKYFGTLKEETPTYIVVDVNGDQRVMKTDIVQRTNGPSAMPQMGQHLTHREIRDVVEYLSTLK